MMLDLSFYRRPKFSKDPIVIKNAGDIWRKTQDGLTLCAVAFFSGLIVWLIFR